MIASKKTDQNLRVTACWDWGIMDALCHALLWRRAPPASRPPDPATAQCWLLDLPDELLLHLLELALASDVLGVMRLCETCKDPRLGKCLKLAMLIRGFLMGLQKMLEEMTAGAYVMVVMQGCSFCVGANESRNLFKVHAKLIVTTELMSSFVLALARICCVGASVLLLFVCLETDAALPTMGLVGLQKPKISSPVAPCLVCGIFALSIVNCYIDIVQIPIQALLLSYAADRELNDQTGMYAMTDRLKNFITGDNNPPFKNAARHSFDPDDKTALKPRVQRGGGGGDGSIVATKDEKSGGKNVKKVVI